MQGRYEAGSLVEVRGERWQLARISPFETCSILTLEGRDRTNQRHRLHVIDPFDRPRLLRNRRLRKSHRQTALQAALSALARERAPGSLWTAAAASIDVWPYQLEPALAIIGGATRVLLADAVGLGKTIQAGLILSELRERGWVRHALIVCPPGLRDGWARELRERFSIDAAILDQEAIADRVAGLPPGVSPWNGHGVAITSIDFIKRPEVLAGLAGVPIDLLIADEAHHLAPGSDRGNAAAKLAGRAPWAVMASATPHSGDEAAYSYLTSLGSTGESALVFRRSRADAGFLGDRRTHVLSVRPTPIERELNAVIGAYAEALWRERGADDHWTRLLAVTLARRTASSTAAIGRTLERRLAALSSDIPMATQAALPWDDDDEVDLAESDAIVSAPGLRDSRSERQLLERAMALVDRGRDGSKLRRVRRILGSVGESVIVFTEYRDTLVAVLTALESHMRTVAIHGGMRSEERSAAVEAFNSGAARVLVATDAAAEGLNLHRQCRLVIDVELPWNPLRLEQRIGRVDRIGQLRTVHAIHLCHADSIEIRVRDRLRLRARRAGIAFDHALSEREVADAVLGGDAPVPRSVRQVTSDAVKTAVAAAARIASQRKWMHSVPHAATHVWSCRKSSTLIVVTRTTFTSTGIARGDAIAAYRVVLATTPSTHAQWREAFDQIAARIHSTVTPPTWPTAALASRIATIRTRIARDRDYLRQQSLFDGRAESGAADRQAAWQRLDHALGDVVNAACSGVRGDGARVELVAAWCERTP